MNKTKSTGEYLDFAWVHEGWRGLSGSIDEVVEESLMGREYIRACSMDSLAEVYPGSSTILSVLPIHSCIDYYESNVPR